MNGKAGVTPTSIDTTANVTLDKVGEGFAITTVHLDVAAKIPGIDQTKFQTIANDADRLRKYLARFGLTWQECKA